MPYSLALALLPSPSPSPSRSPEQAARRLYWAAVSAAPGAQRGGGGATEQIAQLEEAARRNPFVGEPHLVRAQLLLQQGRWAEAEGAASCGVARLAEWAVARTLR